MAKEMLYDLENSNHPIPYLEFFPSSGEYIGLKGIKVSLVR